MSTASETPSLLNIAQESATQAATAATSGEASAQQQVATQQADSTAAEQAQTATQAQAAEQTQEQPCDGEPCGEDQTALIQFLKSEFGDDAAFAEKYTNDMELVKGLVQAQKLVGQRNEASNIVNALRARYGDEGLQQLLSAVPQQPQQQQQQQTQEPEWTAPEYNPAWFQMVHRNEHGRIVPNEGVPQEIADKVTDYLEYREAVLNEFLKSPEQFFVQRVGPQLLQQVEAHLSSQVQQATELANFTRFVHEQIPVLFQDGDPQKPLTPKGEQVTQLADNLIVADPNLSPHRAIQIAWQMLSQVAPPVQHTRPPVPAAMHAPAKAGQKLPKDPNEYLMRLMDTPQANGVPLSLSEAWQKTVDAYNLQ